MGTLYIINLCTMICAIVINLVLTISTLLGRNLKSATQRWFLLSTLANLLSVWCECVNGFLLGTPGPGISALLRAGEYACYVFGALAQAAFSVYLFSYLRTKTKASMAPVHFVWACSAITILLATIAEPNHLFSSFDANNLYIQNSLFWVGNVIPIISLSALIGMTLRYRKSLRPQAFISLLLCGLLPVASLLVDSLVGGLWLSYLASSITLLLVYFNIQIEMKRHIREQDLALAESRMTIMVSQIQPHFLFNTLSAIHALCAENPEAQRALFTFSDYLRGNMDSLTQTTPIPFTREMAHVRHYLWLEGLRFEERLRVVYDIQVEDFLLPVLTLQPLVENAVRHGVTKRRGGGTITIHTEETHSGHRVTVLDDGVGFDPKGPLSAERPHTGIANVRARLATMCGGDLTIQSSPGGGTVASMDIPDHRGACK